MFKTFAVLAGSKKGSLPLLTHVAETRGDEAIRVLCSRVKLNSLADIDADDENEPATCPVCSKRDPRKLIPVMMMSTDELENRLDVLLRHDDAYPGEGAAIEAELSFRRSN